MHANELHAFRIDREPTLTGARVQRVVCVASGLILELQCQPGRTDSPSSQRGNSRAGDRANSRTGDRANSRAGDRTGSRAGDRVELGLLVPRGAARIYCYESATRDDIHEIVRAADESLVAALSDAPARWPRDATVLDALRAWLLRPAAQPPDWLQLEGTYISGVQTREHDRRLWLEFETRDDVPFGDPIRGGRAQARQAGLVLVAELFDRGANFLLRTRSGDPVANWKGRRPAPDKLAATLNATPANTPAQEPTATQTAAGPNAPPAPDRGAEQTWEIAPTLIQLAQASARELWSANARARRRHERRTRTRVQKLEADARRADEAQTWRRMGEALTANLHRVRRGQRHVSLENPYASDETLDIELDPGLSPQQNAALLFKRARRGERGRETIYARLEEARRELARLAQPEAPTATDGPHASAAPESSSVADAAASGTPLDTSHWASVLSHAHSTWTSSLTDALARADGTTLWSPGGPRWERPPEKRDAGRPGKRHDGPGRCFTLPGDWEVRVGRSNAENDELTHRFAQPDDVWLHASGVPGSHVVLRMKGLRDNPPHDVLEAAAAIAARFSRAKHARTVPVIWTRKRYVRKPRKSKPGVATCTHEKTVFVQPGLPPGASPAGGSDEGFEA